MVFDLGAIAEPILLLVKKGVCLSYLQEMAQFEAAWSAATGKRARPIMATAGAMVRGVM